MTKNTYKVSKESLNRLLYYVKELVEVGTFISEEYKKESMDLRSEVLADGVKYKLDENYKDIYRLVNIICNDDTIDGELY